MNILLVALSEVPATYLPTAKAFFDETQYEPYAIELKENLINLKQKKEVIHKLLEKVVYLESEQNAAQKVLADIKLILEDVTL